MADHEKHKMFGLIGYPLSHSFSETYFKKKFMDEGISDSEYVNFPLPDLDKLPDLLDSNPGLRGLNVTIPHKEKVIPFLNDLDPLAKKIGAVNTIIIIRDGRTNYLKGFNTDVFGFEKSLGLCSGNGYRKALILGTGGASKAVKHVLDKLCDRVLMVSRNPVGQGVVSYSELNRSIMEEYHLIVNTTPLGTFPNVDLSPPLPYEYINENHYLFDLVYNPEVTRFLLHGQDCGARIRNGKRMLIEQAESAWNIWNQPELGTV